MANVPSVALKEEDFRDGVVDIMQVLVSAGLCATRSEARRAVEQGGVLVNEEKVSDVKTTYTKDFFADGIMVKKGKKSFKKVTC
jgi:tyrosyl-tRNA synthetase